MNRLKYALIVIVFSFLPVTLHANPAISLSPGATSPTGGTLHLNAVDSSGADAVGAYQMSIYVVPEAGATGMLTLTASTGNVPAFTDATANFLRDTTNNNTYFITSDSSNNYPQTATLNATPVTLFDLNYSASAGASGSFDIDFFTSATDSFASQLDDGNFAPIPGTTFANRVVTVTPEPASLCAIAVMSGFCLLRRRRARPTAG